MLKNVTFAKVVQAQTKPQTKAIGQPRKQKQQVIEDLTGWKKQIPLERFIAKEVRHAKNR